MFKKYILVMVLSALGVGTYIGLNFNQFDSQPALADLVKPCDNPTERVLPPNPVPPDVADATVVNDKIVLSGAHKEKPNTGCITYRVKRCSYVNFWDRGPLRRIVSWPWRGRPWFRR